MNKMVRKQIFITTEQNKRLKARAAAIGVSEAELIRAGIDLRLQEQGEKQKAWSDTVAETVANLSGAWAERDDLDETLRRHRKGWKRRLRRLGLAQE